MLEISNLTKYYGDRIILDDISLSLPTGRIVSLMGANGSGKTTFFKALLGLTAFQGSVFLDNRALDSRRIGYLPEERSLFPDCCVEKQLHFFAGLKGMERKEAEEAVKMWAEKLKIVQYLNSEPSSLSKGNQQKVQLAIALINDPELIILDEPWTGLDEGNTRLFEKVLNELRKQGKTVILSSHLYQPVQRICDHYLFLHKGKIVIDLTRGQLNTDSRRVIAVTSDQYLLLEDEGILSERRKPGQIRYLVRNDESASRILSLLQRLPAVTSVTVRHPVIDDFLEEY